MSEGITLGHFILCYFRLGKGKAERKKNKKAPRNVQMNLIGAFYSLLIFSVFVFNMAGDHVNPNAEILSETDICNPQSMQPSPKPSKLDHDGPKLNKRLVGHLI